MSWATRSEPEQIRQSLEKLPLDLGPWHGRLKPSFDEEVLASLGVDDYLSRVYSRPDGAVVDCYIGYYKSQRQGDTMHSPLNCLPGAGWNPVERGDLQVALSKGGANGSTAASPRHSIEVNRIIIQKGLNKQVVLYWYQSHGRVIASEYWGKIFTVIDAIRINRTDAAMVRVISPVVSLEEQAEAAAQNRAIDFVCEMFPLLDQFLPN
jgi:EpsI family protein